MEFSLPTAILIRMVILHGWHFKLENTISEIIQNGGTCQMENKLDVAGIPVPTTYGTLDGVSFYDNMLNIPGSDRTWSFCHWDNSPNDLKPPIRYVQDTTYKLHDDPDYSRFYNIVQDPEETNPLPNTQLDGDEGKTKTKFVNILQQMHE